MHLPRPIPTLLTFALLASGCGQTGALYLPDSRRDETSASTPASDNQPAGEDSQNRKQRAGSESTPATDTHTPTSPPDPDRPAEQIQPPSDR